MKVLKVAPSFAAKTWPDVEKFFASVVEHSGGEWTLDQAKSDILTGRWGLIVVVDESIVGAIAYTYQNRRNSRTAFISALAGRAITTDDNWVQLKAIFAADGATEVEAAMRPSTLRLWSRLGFKDKYQIAGCAL